MGKKSDVRKAKSRINTAKNKIHRIEKALKHAGGSAVDQLKTRLEYWKKQG